MSGLTIVVLGATGAVGREMLSCLEERGIEVADLRLLASERSAGTELEFRGKIHEVKAVHPDLFRDVQIALFSAGSAASKEWAPIAAKAGATVIDNSSAFRTEKAIPLIVPEVNADVLREYLARERKGGIIANPNCAAIQMVVVLKPIADSFGLKRIVVSTYQSVSGAGQKGIDELSTQVISLFSEGKAALPKTFPHQIAFNCIPQIDAFAPNGSTKEEVKIMEETRKILSLPNLKISVTSVRVPTFACHSESVNIETEKAAPVANVQALLRGSPGIVVVDDPDKSEYPLGLDVVGTDATYVGRIRRDESLEHGINLWIVADNLRKGAALNAVQIAEIVIHERSIH